MKEICTIILAIWSFVVAGQTTSKQKKENSSVDTIKVISYKMKYPVEARKKGIEGTVKIKVIFDQECNIVKKEVVKSIGYGCDEEAIEALKHLEEKLKKKRTKYQDGEEMILPFNFRLN